MINIKTNIAQFIKTEIKKWDDTVKRATIAAENKTAAQGLTFTKRIIREDYNIKASDLAKVIKNNPEGIEPIVGGNIISWSLMYKEDVCHSYVSESGGQEWFARYNFKPERFIPPERFPQLR